MAREIPLTAYVEVQIDEDSISLSLISESRDGPVIEDTARFTFGQLEGMAGQHSSISLSAETEEALQGAQPDSPTAEELLAEMETTSRPMPDSGQVMVDDNPAPWSQDTRVVVEEYLSDVKAEDYVIEGTSGEGTLEKHLQSAWDENVADANPSYPADDGVILAHYEGSTEQYAFPESRLVEDSRTRSSQQ